MPLLLLLLLLTCSLLCLLLLLLVLLLLLLELFFFRLSLLPLSLLLLLLLLLFLLSLLLLLTLLLLLILLLLLTLLLLLLLPPSLPLLSSLDRTPPSSSSSSSGRHTPESRANLTSLMEGLAGTRGGRSSPSGVGCLRRVPCTLLLRWWWWLLWWWWWRMGRLVSDSSEPLRTGGAGTRGGGLALCLSRGREMRISCFCPFLKKPVVSILKTSMMAVVTRWGPRLGRARQPDAQGDCNTSVD